jgi:hypothetical protein
MARLCWWGPRDFGCVTVTTLDNQSNAIRSNSVGGACITWTYSATIVTPKAVANFELVSPDKNNVFTSRQEAVWGDVQAKFQTGKESGLKHGMDANSTITRYDFGKKVPREAMEEAVRQEITNRVQRLQWPRSIARKEDGSYVSLPIPLNPKN